jgi:TetR/AcrR family transcriptional regulator, lmrAB and yxaGH operons repressor
MSGCLPELQLPNDRYKTYSTDPALFEQFPADHYEMEHDMARPRSVGEDDLISRLARVFCEVGYNGASLAQLAAAARLQKASLYHRFPGGKAQMAAEVLAAATGWLADHVIAPLCAAGPPPDRLALVVRALDGFYDGGRKSCLLNMLSSPRAEDGPFSPAIRVAFGLLTDAFTRLAADAGCPPEAAAWRARRAVSLLQGSLVVSRGTGTDAPFREFLDHLPDDLISTTELAR